MNRLVFLRMKRGLTQKQLAKRIGVSAGLLSRVERGWFARPPEGMERRLQAIFGREWNFNRLMEPVPDLAAGSTGFEARA